MKIGIAAGNYMDMRVGNNNVNHRNAINTSTGSVFGPQCRVTISSEGRRLSRQSGAEEPKSFAAGSAERLLLRQQKQSEQSRSEQSDTLKEISGLMSAIRSSYAAGEDRETIANKQEALNRLLDLKARQEEENEQRVKDAAGSVADASKEQKEIDEKNADLYLMLKSLEEQEEDEENTDRGSGAESDAAGTKDRQGSAGDEFQQSASMLGASAARRELQAKGMIDGMFESGYGRLAEADAMMHEVHAELSLAMESLSQQNLSEDEKDQLMAEHIGRANSMLQSNYGDIMDLRRKGHQEIRDAQEVSLRHIAVSPLDGADDAKKAIMDAGAAAALREVSQDTLDKASEELEEKVQEAVDKRNDTVTGSREDEEQVKEEQEKTAEEEQAKKEQEEEALEKNSILMN